MASCADGTLPESMPAAAGDPGIPIPGIPAQTPALDPREPNKAIPQNDPFSPAYDELFNYLLLLINDYPGAWASWDSVEKQELLRPKIMTTVEDAHAVAW
eukprot:6773744-Pyramimonas_sp.AAC.1